MRFRPLFSTFLMAAALALSPSSHAQKRGSSQTMGEPYADRPDAMQLADEIAQHRNIDPNWTRRILSQAQYLPTVQRLMLPAPRGTAKNWRVYRSRFIDNVRIQAGVRFWQNNRSTLERAERVYGVPAEIIVGIIGVETIFGRDTGNFRVLDTLATLALNFPTEHPKAQERNAYFRGELEQFLGQHYRNGTDPSQPRGSYAGAMGMPQFMPSSWIKYAVDFDGDGTIDLTNSPADVIGSVANYFKAYGWQPGVPTHYPVRFDLQRLDKAALLAPDILPTFSVANFSARGAVLDIAGQQHHGNLALIELQNGDDAPTYVAGTDNFYCITRYNWSSYYAMSVIDLGNEIAAVVRGR